MKAYCNKFVGTTDAVSCGARLRRVDRPGGRSHCVAIWLGALSLVAAYGQDPPPAGVAPVAKKGPRQPRPPRPGVSTPGVKREMTAITPEAVFPIEGTPDWQVITDEAVWVSNGPKNTIHRLDPKTNKVEAAITVGRRPCSGLAAGFGSIWVPSCGDKTVSRVDIKTRSEERRV